jgi:hypothetical protein
MIMFYLIMILWYASQNTHANRVVLVFVHIVVLNHSWSREVTNMWWLIFPYSGGSCSLHIDFLTSITSWYFFYDLLVKLTCKSISQTCIYFLLLYYFVGVYWMLFIYCVVELTLLLFIIFRCITLFYQVIFIGLLEPALLIVINAIMLCLVSAPHLLNLY